MSKNVSNVLQLRNRISGTYVKGYAIKDSVFNDVFIVVDCPRHFDNPYHLREMAKELLKLADEWEEIIVMEKSKFHMEGGE